MAETYTIIWNGNVIGSISDLRADMSFFEGIYIPAISTDAKTFAELITGFDIQVTFKDPNKGTNITLVSKNDPTISMNFIVLALLDNLLSLRKIQ